MVQNAAPTTGASALRADLVLEGGGVKGIALAGALEVLEERGYRFNRVAGSSAGAIAGALVTADIPAPTIVQVLREVDYTKFQDGPWWTRFLIGKGLSLLVHKGINPGRYASEWLTEQLEAHGASGGASTFADLAYADPEGGDGPGAVETDAETSGDADSRFIVTASDISAGRLRLLPRDAGKYGMSPAQLRVVAAVRASTAMPFFFRPVRWRNADGQRAYLVDGGMLSNFPVGVFDRPAGAVPRWPTFGIKLSARPPEDPAAINIVRGPLSYAKALLDTLIGARDRMHIDADDTVDRTIFIDTSFVEPTEFDLSEEDREQLYQAGRKAATDFLDGTGSRPAWDFDAYIARHRMEHGA